MVSTRWCSAAAAAAVIACACGVEAPEEVGGVRLVASGAFMTPSSPSALSVEPVASVVLRATPLFTGGKSFVQPLTLDPLTGKYEAQILNMKVGDYLFRADATAASGDVLFTAEQVFTIERKVIGLVALVLQQAAPPDPVQLIAPRITALTFSTAEPYFGETITMSVTAENRNPTGTLTYLWQATCDATPDAVNEFSAATSATTQLTSTCATGLNVQVSAILNDPPRTGEGGLISRVGAHLPYRTQGAEASIELNSWPTITSLRGLGQAPESPNEWDWSALLLIATAEDDDGDALTFTWSNDCGGWFDVHSDEIESYATFWTPMTIPPPDGACTVTVTARDGRGGSAAGSVTVWIGVPTPTTSGSGALAAAG